MPSYDATSAVTPGTGPVTLAALEREVARRLGPYRREAVATSPNVRTFTIAALTSTIEKGAEWQDLYLLRRGEKSDGTTLTVAADDRVRMVKLHEWSTGTFTIDRDYATEPVATEYVEFHHLDPSAELRPAVLAGLKRCWFRWEREQVTLSSNAAERDLGALLAWVTDPDQIYEVEYVSPSAFHLPGAVDWYRAYRKAGSVWLATNPDPYPQALLITGRRQHFTYVNGTTNLNGPSADADVLPGPLEYEAAAGHIEAWRSCGPRLQAAAAEGFYPSQAAAAEVFTAQAKAHYPRRSARLAVAHPPYRSRQEDDEVVA